MEGRKARKRKRARRGTQGRKNKGKNRQGKEERKKDKRKEEKEGKRERIKREALPDLNHTSPSKSWSVRRNNKTDNIPFPRRQTLPGLGDRRDKVLSRM